MIGIFKRLFGGGGAKPSLDSVRFDTTGYHFQGEPQPGTARFWFTPEGDGLGVYFIPMSPDIPADAASTDELAAHYCHSLGDSGGRLVEIHVVATGGGQAVRTIFSFPQQPSGRTYVGSLTVPFREFSFVIKCQCVESGPTGAKEALLVDRSLAANEVLHLEGKRYHIPGWNPDDPKFDVEFPAHPVARARRVLDHVAGSLIVADEIRELPGCRLPRSRG